MTGSLDLRAALPLRGTIIGCARSLAIEVGWHNVRMAQVAYRAGTTRQTVYNMFSSKAGLAEAVAHAEIVMFVNGVAEVIEAHECTRDAVHATVRHVLVEAGRNPLVKAIVTGSRDGGDALLPYLTTRADSLLAAASSVLLDWAVRRLPEASSRDLGVAVDSVVRLVLSHVVLPSGSLDETALNLADVVESLFDRAQRRGRSVA